MKPRFLPANLFSERKDANRETILLLPGHLFFTECLDYPPDLDAQGLESLATLTLEGLTPFPIEQLSWGYAACPRSQRLFLFAAFRESLKKVGFTSLESYRHVYPDFLLLDGTHLEQDSLLSLETDSSLTAAAFKAGSRVPHAIQSAPRHADDDTRTDLQSLAQGVNAEGLAPADTRSPPFQLSWTDDGTVECRSNGATTASWSRDMAWTADLRDSTFAAQEVIRRRRDHTIWRSILAGIAVAAILLFLQVGLFAGRFWLARQQEQIQAQAPAAERIQSRNELVNRLEQRATGSMRPFLALESLNRERPSTVYFTAAEASNFNRVTVDAIARTVNEVNTFAGALRDSGDFDRVDVQINRSQAGQVTFTLRIQVGEPPATSGIATRTATP